MPEPLTYLSEHPSLFGESLAVQIAALLAAILALTLVVVCFRNPAVGRFVGKSVAIVSMGLGVGCLVWGIIAAARGEQLPVDGLLAGVSFSLVIGSGAGFLTAGIVALVLACLIRVPARGDLRG